MTVRKLFRHSNLYYRNRAIVWGVTALVYFLIVLSQANKTFMFLLLPALYFAANLWSICLSIHPRRRYLIRKMTPKDFGLSYQQATFYSRDGTKLSGWHIPSWSRQAVILVHGLGSSGVAMARHARLFSTAGGAFPNRLRRQ